MKNTRWSIDMLHVGDVAELSYRGSPRFTAEFRGWSIDNGRPVASFEDPADHSGWDAYMFQGKMCVGSSADELRVHSVIQRS